MLQRLCTSRFDVSANCMSITFQKVGEDGVCNLSRAPTLLIIDRGYPKHLTPG